MTVGEPETVADLTVLVKNDDGTWSVCDNGEEVICDTEADVIRIICENLSDSVITKAAATLGRKGGKSTSAAKQAAARANASQPPRPGSHPRGRPTKKRITQPHTAPPAPAITPGLFINQKAPDSMRSPYSRSRLSLSFIFSSGVSR